MLRVLSISLRNGFYLSWSAPSLNSVVTHSLSVSHWPADSTPLASTLCDLSFDCLSEQGPQRVFWSGVGAERKHVPSSRKLGGRGGESFQIWVPMAVNAFLVIPCNPFIFWKEYFVKNTMHGMDQVAQKWGGGGSQAPQPHPLHCPRGVLCCLSYWYLQ